MSKRFLMDDGGLAVAVCVYAPDERHEPHTDEFSRISFVLKGGYREEGRSGTLSLAPGDVLLKSRAALHEDQFGQHGARLIAIEFRDDDPFDASDNGSLWRRRADGFALRHAVAMVDAAVAGDATSVAAAASDLITDQGRGAPEAEAPPWLRRLHQDLEDAPLACVHVEQRARSAGAHPAHASRLFRRCFGTSITEHAQNQSVRRAVGALAHLDMPLSEVALKAGFYDQSHMNRVFRRILGRTPGAQRNAFAAMAS